jgi:hypothetical protein
VRETLLTRIEINCGNALPGFEKRNRYMQCGGGLSRSTLLVTEHNNVR